MNRREFVKTMIAAGIASALPGRASAAEPTVDFVAIRERSMRLGETPGQAYVRMVTALNKAVSWIQRERRNPADEEVVHAVLLDPAQSYVWFHYVDRAYWNKMMFPGGPGGCGPLTSPEDFWLMVPNVPRTNKHLAGREHPDRSWGMTDKTRPTGRLIPADASVRAKFDLPARARNVSGLTGDEREGFVGIWPATNVLWTAKVPRQCLGFLSERNEGGSARGPVGGLNANVICRKDYQGVTFLSIPAGWRGRPDRWTGRPEASFLVDGDWAAQGPKRIHVGPARPVVSPRPPKSHAAKPVSPHRAGGAHGGPLCLARDGGPMPFRASILESNWYKLERH
jgi:hypothetical protein